VAGEFQVLFVAVFRQRELDQFHFLKLVLADDAADVAAVGAGFAAETGRVGAEGDGQFFGGDGFVAEEVGHRDFGGGGEPEVVAFAVK